MQVQRKSRALANFLAGLPEIQRAYAAMQLARKLISQCEVQVRHLSDTVDMIFTRDC